MSTNIEDVKRHVTLLSDEALLDVPREDLTESAQAVYEAELASRGLAWPAAAVSEEEEDPEAAAAAGGGLVSIAKYESIEDGRFARDLLRNEGIPAWFAAELAIRKGDTDPLAGLELLTQAVFLEQAQQLLSSEVSDEELAQQAETAGLTIDAEDELPEDPTL